MLRRQPKITHSRNPDWLRHRGVAGHRLLTGIENNPRRSRPTRHRREERQSTGKVDVVVVAIVEVAEDSPADLHFGDAGLLNANGKRPRPATAHDLYPVASLPASIRARRELADRQPDRALLLP